MEQESIISNLYDKFDEERDSSKEYKNLISKFNIHMDEFRKEITKEKQNKLDLLLQIRNDMESIETKDYFIEGFKLATRIMTEVFYKEDK